MTDSQKKPVVLIVEDETDLHVAYSTYLSKDAECLFAVNLQTMQEALPKCDVVIADYSIPGVSFDQLLIESGTKPVLLVTGYSEPLFCRQLDKPFSKADLLKEVHGMVESLSAQSKAALKIGDVVVCHHWPELGQGQVKSRIDDSPYLNIEFRDRRNRVFIIKSDERTLDHCIEPIKG